jgi:hypothetical protein
MSLTTIAQELHEAAYWVDRLQNEVKAELLGHADAARNTIGKYLKTLAGEAEVRLECAMEDLDALRKAQDAARGEDGGEREEQA